MGEFDPPPDLSREEAAYQRDKERLVRDHLGGIAVIRYDEIIGVFRNFGEAVTEGRRRFGMGRMIFREITAKDEPEFVSFADVNHPCVRRLGPHPAEEHGNFHGAR